MEKNIAIIDLGTNTFNLLILTFYGDRKHEILFNTKIGVGLGLGGINENRIAPEAFVRGVEALQEYKKIANSYDVEMIYATGTSALRNAENRSDFIKEVNQKTGIAIEVVSGEEEVKLIYRGALLGYQIKEPTLIMDIGGGSTEFILCDKSGILKFGSFEIGVARILQKFDLSDPYTQADQHNIEAYLEEHLGAFMDGIEANILMGTSGSFETFFAMKFGINYPENEYVEMDSSEALQILQVIIDSTLDERKKNEWIIPIRQKMLPIAAIKVNYILRKLRNENIVISPFSLKEGIMQNILDKYAE